MPITRETASANGKKGGRPKGSKASSTLEREAVLKEFRMKVMRAADVLFTSQLHIARGQTYLYKIEKELLVGPKGGKKYVKSKPILVESQSEIEQYLLGLVEEGDPDDENDPLATYYFLTAKDPDNKAIDSLLDRTFGKATQPIDGELKASLMIAFDQAFHREKPQSKPKKK
jgi:hypothetical protein